MCENTGMSEFKEPKPNFLVTSAAQLIAPFWLKWREQLTINICGGEENLAAFSNHRRAVVLLNHPDRQVPFVIVELAMQMRETFYCIAARECFDWDGGWRGWLFQRLGCYSVARGKADFHSIATTDKILREGKRKLVVFPEAEITADEQTVHELQNAIFHIILNVQKDLSAQNAEGSEASAPASSSASQAASPGASPASPLVIIPGAIKFTLKSKLASAVGPALKTMEKKLAIRKARGKAADVMARIDGVVAAYLKRVFESYELVKPEASLEKLAEVASVEILKKIAAAIECEFDPALSPTNMLYFIRNKASDKMEASSVALEPDAFYCAGIPKPCLGSDFERVERLLILQRMLMHHSSEIQCCRMLDFIESELFGAITPKGQQFCSVELGSPIEVEPFVEQFLQSKEAAVTGLSDHFKQQLQMMLNKD